MGVTLSDNIKSNLKQATIEAKVIRKDGTVENLGVVSYYHKNPLKRFWWNLKKLFKVK